MNSDFDGRSSLKKCVLYLLISVLGSIALVLLHLETPAKLFPLPFAAMAGFYWLKTVLFRCPKCGRPWPLGLGAKCGSCNQSYEIK